MLSLFNIFNIVHVVGTLGTAILCIIIIREKSSRNEKLLGLMGISILFDMIAYYLEMNATNLDSAIVCSKMELLSLLLMNTFCFIFVLRLCDIPFATPILIIFMVIDIVFGFYFVGFGFDKVYSSVSFVNSGAFPHLVIKEGIVFIINCGFNVLLYIIELILIIRRARNNGSKVSKEFILLLLPGIIPVLALAYRFTPFYQEYTYVPLHIAYALTFALCSLIIF